MHLEDFTGVYSVRAMKYAHCPLKKRPVPALVERERREELRATTPTRPKPPHPAHLNTTINYSYHDTENDEPENLSTKPEDLSKTGNYPNKASSPMATAAVKEDQQEWQHEHIKHLAASNTCLESTSSELAHRTQHYAYLQTFYNPYHLEERWPVRQNLSPSVQAQLNSISSSSLSPSSLSPPPYPEDLRSTSSISSDSGISLSASCRPRYECSDCAKSYSTYSGLTKHQQHHCVAAKGSLARKYISCKFCAKVYSTLGALKMHIRTHTLPCKCHLCGKAFSRPWLLQGHIRTHTGEKPFSCQHCRRAFADRSNLRAHLQTHSDVKKYSCCGCGKTFSRMSLMSKHAETGCSIPGSSSHKYRGEPFPAPQTSPQLLPQPTIDAY